MATSPANGFATIAWGVRVRRVGCASVPYRRLTGRRFQRRLVRARPSAISPIPTARCRCFRICCPRALSDERADRSDRFDANESMEEAEQADPIEKTEHAEPIDPIERTDPTEPIESTEPSLANERIDPEDRTDQRDGFTIGATLVDGSFPGGEACQGRSKSGPLAPVEKWTTWRGCEVCRGREDGEARSAEPGFWPRAGRLGGFGLGIEAL